MLERYDGQRDRGRGRGRGTGRGPSRGRGPGQQNVRAAAPKPQPNLLEPNGQIWQERPNGWVNRRLDNIYDRPTIFNWSCHHNYQLIQDLDIKDEIDYFFLAYPMQTLSGMVNATTANMNAAEAAVRGQRNAKLFFAFSQIRFFNFLGIEMQRALHPLRGGVEDCWKKGCDEGTFREGGNYGERFGMRLHEYKNIKQYLQLGEFTLAQCQHDPWIRVSLFIDAFNERREKIIKPGRELIIDESMLWWTGKDGEIHYGGMPHKSYVISEAQKWI